MDETNETIELEIEAYDAADLLHFSDWPNRRVEPPVLSIRLADNHGKHYDVPLEHVISIRLGGHFSESIKKDWRNELEDDTKSFREIDLKLDEEGFWRLAEGEGGLRSALQWLRWSLSSIYYLDVDGKIIDRFDKGWDQADLEDETDEHGNVLIRITGGNPQ